MKKLSIWYKWDFYLSKAILYFIFFYMNTLQESINGLLVAAFIGCNLLYYTREIGTKQNTWKDFYQEYASDFYIQFLIVLIHFWFNIKGADNLIGELIVVYIIMIVSPIMIMLIKYFTDRYKGIALAVVLFIFPSYFLPVSSNKWCTIIIHFIISTFVFCLCICICILIKVFLDGRSEK